MFKKFIYFISMFMVVSFCSINAYTQPGSTHKINKQPSSKMVNSTNNNQEEQRPVLTVTPREIDLGAIKPGEIAFGEYSLKNIAPGELKWSTSCPDDWESVADKTLKGTASNEPTYLRLELAITESNGNVSGEKARIANYRTSMKMEAAGKELICQKNLKAGNYRKAIIMTSTGGQRTIFLDFRIHALQEIPSISLNPQRLDLGVQLPGKIMSKRIELTNRGREMLKWSVVPSEAKS